MREVRFKLNDTIVSVTRNQFKIEKSFEISAQKQQILEQKNCSNKMTF